MKSWKRVVTVILIAAMPACGVSDGRPAEKRPTPPAATIAPFDVSEVTCREAEELDEYEYYLLLMYMQGYIDAKRGNTVFNMDQKAALTEKVEAACKADPSLFVLNEFLKASGR